MIPAVVEERIGDYRVHPAAALFPLLEDDDTDFDALKSSILERGQLLPILVQGDVLLDGRNRLRACLAVGVKPRVEEYNGPLTGSELISELNLSRRDLEPEERAIITGKIFVMIQRERKTIAQKAAGARGVEGGRGHKKTLVENSPQGFNRAPRTVDQIAAKAGVSEHVARQAVLVIQHAPDLAEQVQRGRMKLREAAQQARTRVPAKPKRKAGSSFAKIQQQILTRIRKVCAQFPRQRPQLIQSIQEVLTECRN